MVVFVVFNIGCICGCFGGSLVVVYVVVCMGCHFGCGGSLYRVCCGLLRYLVSVSSWEWRCPVVARTIRFPTSQSTACWRVMVVEPALAVEASLVQVTFGLPD